MESTESQLMQAATQNTDSSQYKTLITLPACANHITLETTEYVAHSWCVWWYACGRSQCHPPGLPEYGSLPANQCSWSNNVLQCMAHSWLSRSFLAFMHYWFTGPEQFCVIATIHAVITSLYASTWPSSSYCWHWCSLHMQYCGRLMQAIVVGQLRCPRLQICHDQAQS